MVRVTKLAEHADENYNVISYRGTQDTPVKATFTGPNTKLARIEMLSSLVLASTALRNVERLIGELRSSSDPSITSLSSLLQGQLAKNAGDIRRAMAEMHRLSDLSQHRPRTSGVLRLPPSRWLITINEISLGETSASRAVFMDFTSEEVESLGTLVRRSACHRLDGLAGLERGVRRTRRAGGVASG